MSLTLQPYKGMRDLYPSDMRLRNYIFATWRKVAERFGYEEYATPMLEPLELYAAKSGEEIVNEQTYTFIDRGDRKVAIRPEMTPSIARMVAAKRQEIALPARLYSIANFLRYERPQKGREREFWQLNMDVFGIDGRWADIEIIAISDAIMREFGATDEMFTIKISDRRWIDFVMRSYLELDEEKAGAMIKLFDRFNKLSRETFSFTAVEIFAGNNPASHSGLDPESSQESMKILKQVQDDNSNDDAAKAEFLAKVEALLVENPDDLPEQVRGTEFDEIRKVLDSLKQKGINNAVFDPTLMRGFDYYTGIVFEAFDNAPENNRAMFGGGRYDGLVGLFGVEPLATVGMAPGETTTMEFLKAHNLIPELKPTTEIMIIPLGGVDVENVAQELRAGGMNVAVEYTNRKTDKMIKSAVKAEIPHLLFVGEKELNEQKFTLKNVATQEEQKMRIDEIIKLDE